MSASTKIAPFRFPGGRSKALVLSYDDGSEHDRRLVDILNRYGIRGTFHLNSGRLDQPHHVTRGELRSLYAGHEVASHTVRHPDLTKLPEDAIRREIEDDRRTLQEQTGHAVRGLAYPFGTYDGRIVRIARELGVAYARTASGAMTLELPGDLLAWAPSGHHNAALPLAKTFLARPANEIALLLIVGHSFELDGFMSADRTKNWEYMEALCRLLHGHASVWYATAIEVAEYAIALARVEASAERLHNASDTTIWVHAGGEDVALPPGAVLFSSSRAAARS